MEVILTSIVAAGFPQLRNRGFSLYRYDALSESFPDTWHLSDQQIVRRYSSENSRHGITGRVLDGGQPLTVADTLTAEGMSPYLPLGIRSFVAIPVQVFGVPWGVLYVNSPEPNAFTDADLDFCMALARQIGHYVEEAGQRSSGNVELSTVRALAAAVDAKDPYTRHHSTNVSFYARRIAREMNLDPAEVHRIDLAGMMHDIGKIAIPDHVLQKTDRLAPEERTLIETHASVGANILAQAYHLHHLVPLVRHHHEWYDGRGYPDRLAGNDIPLGAAIISVADAFDTMTTRRVYRPARTLEEAMAELRRCIGTQFHPEVVGAMESLVAKAQALNEPWLKGLGSTLEPRAGALTSPYDWDGALEDVHASVGQHRDPLEFLVETQQVQSLGDLAVMLANSGEQALNYWSADAVQLYLVNRDTGMLKLAWDGGSAAGQRFLAECRQQPEMSMTRGLLGWAVLANQGIILSDARRDPRWSHSAEFEGPVSVMIAPLSCNGAPVGAIQVVSRGETRFGRPDMRAIRVFSNLVGQGVSRFIHAEANQDRYCTDSLTGVWNANYLSLYLERVASQGLVTPTSVAFLDGDNLQGMNERYGYEVGDRIIRHMALSLRAWLRKDDELIRYGGDKFMLFLPGLSLPEASARIEQVRMAISEVPVELPDGMRVYVSVSGGVAEVLPEHGPSRAIRSAEQATFNAKRTGKNRVWTAAV